MKRKSVNFFGNKQGNSCQHFQSNQKQMLKCKRSQVAVFVIIALVIIGGVVGYFIVKDDIFVSNVPAEIKPVYDYYLSCIEVGLEDGVSILGTQGGYIELPAFESGSDFAPFSNQLDFMGQAIPYWYYVSGNGLIKEQVPRVSDMEEDLGGYVSDKLGDCDFTEFRRQGFNIEAGEAEADTQIADNKITANVKQSLIISKYGDIDENGEVVEEFRTVINRHSVDVDSSLGEYYELAKAVYNYQKEEAFLESYTKDVLFNYAPVAGAEISCSPLFWNPNEVVEDLQNGLEANIGMIKVEGNYYEDADDYFVVDTGFEARDRINFLYNSDWASRFEIWPAKGDVMTASPVGTQPGLSAMGFCYVPYKFVYDIYIPVLMQISSEDGEEIFQVPMAVVINKNQEREAMDVELEEEGFDVCDNANQDIIVYTYDDNLAPVEADVEFNCFSNICNLGKTVNEDGTAKLEVQVPQCTNGVLIVNAEGYAEKQYVMSTNEEIIADVILEKENKLAVEIYVDGRLTNEVAVLTILSNEDNVSGPVASVSYPILPELSLAEGDYEFDLKVYSNRQIRLPATKREECVDVPKSGVLGIFGIKDEKCFEYNIPAQTMSNVLYAGGRQVQYVTDSELRGSSRIRVYANSVQLPTNIEEIPDAYNLIELKDLIIEFV